MSLDGLILRVLEKAEHLLRPYLCSQCGPRGGAATPGGWCLWCAHAINHRNRQRRRAKGGVW